MDRGGVGEYYVVIGLKSLCLLCFGPYIYLPIEYPCSRIAYYAFVVLVAIGV